jgi:hypothetical protein
MPDEHVERGWSTDVCERRAWLAALEQERVPGRLVPEEPDSAVAVPPSQRLGLVFGLPIAGKLQLEDGPSSRLRG